ncbi:MAG: biopolymer transporter ExbD [Phycisphaerales bacterium]|nr:biopolymer transporter ExbD [Phycisphaerales bacterium]
MIGARRTRLRSRRRAHHGPNMTPMVDVVLVILIFFMAATGLAVSERFLRTGLPRDPGQSASGDTPAPSAESPTLPPSRALLRITREGRRTLVTGLGMDRVGLGDISRRLQDFADADASDSIIVVVAPDGDVPYQDVVILHDACAKAGIANVRLGLVERAGS